MTRTRRIAETWAGPILIASCVLFALRGFVFQARLSDAHPDLLTFWLPRWTFLGRALASGHLPLWNPYEMAGYRFAADPQSGWLYVPPMALFSTLGPGAAFRAFIVANPLIAGLGLYAFLRIEGLSRAAATCGGLSIAMIMAASTIAVSLPFAGALAWTTVLLVGAAGYRRASRWSRRLLWMGLGGLAWSQIACAHMSHGLVVGTTLVTAYLLVGAVVDVRERNVSTVRAAGRGLLFLGFLPLAALPVLIPRLAFIASSSLAGGYQTLGETGRASGVDLEPIATNGVWSAWPVAFGVAPGAYAGAVMLLAVPLALRARRRRALVWVFGGALVLTYVLMLDIVVTAPWFRWLMLKVPFGDVYLHNPGRLRYLAVVALPVLGAVGIQGLRDDMLPMRTVLKWLAAGTALWLVLPLVAGGHPFPFLLLAVAVPCAGAGLAYVATRRTGSAALVVVGVLTAELLAGAVWSSLWPGDTVTTGLEAGISPNLSAQPLRYPDIPQDRFLVGPSFVGTLRGANERFMTWAPPAAAYQKGYLFMQDAKDRAALAMSRGSLFSIHDALGYNPVQLPRYWRYVRAVDPLPMYYNAAVVNRPTPSTVHLMGVRWLTVPDGVPPPLPVRRFQQGPGYRLYELANWEPRVSVTDAWRVVKDSDAALQTVGSPGFDPAAEAVLEADPGVPRSLMGPVEAGTGSYAESDPEHVRVGVDAVDPSIVVIRTSYDPGWHATVDGRPAPVLAADGWLQGVAVGAGHHEIRLTYDDPDVVRGLLAGAVVWVGLLVAWGAALARERGRGRRTAAGPAAPVPSR